MKAFRGTITFEAEQVFYKRSFGYKEIGYLPRGCNRKRWFPIDGKVDETNDYSETEVVIEEI